MSGKQGHTVVENTVEPAICLMEHKWGQLEQWQVNMDGKMDRILEQTTKTNGRISSLEIWKARIITALIVIALLVNPVSLGLGNKSAQPNPADQSYDKALTTLVVNLATNDVLQKALIQSTTPVPVP